MIILRERNPYQLYLLAACVLGGIAGLVAPSTDSSAVAKSLPGWAVLAWYAGLVTGGGVGLVGSLMRGTNGLLVERVGHVMIAGFALLYSALLIGETGPRGTFAALFIAALAAAAAARFAQINRTLKRAEAEAEARPDARGDDR